jgi:hypothetical protein
VSCFVGTKADFKFLEKKLDFIIGLFVFNNFFIWVLLNLCYSDKTSG